MVPFSNKGCKIKFSKMHGLGNDFIVIDAQQYPFAANPDVLIALANRHTGVGFDQLLLVYPNGSVEADFRYRIFNADGSEVEQCGNGARCIAAFIKRKKLSEKNSLKLCSKKGIIHADIRTDGLISINMGAPVFEPAQIPFIAEVPAPVYTLNLSTTSLNVAVLSMGNPHCVLFVENLASAPIATIGQEISRHPRFPEGVNVGFAQIVNPENIELRVLERGVGETLACGSGACAAVVAGILSHKLSNKVAVNLRGGWLDIEWQGNSSPVIMTGPAKYVYEGEIDLDELNG